MRANINIHINNTYLITLGACPRTRIGTKISEDL